MSGAIVAAALLSLGSASTSRMHPLVEMLEQIAQPSAEHGAVVHHWLGRTFGTLAGHLFALDIQRAPSDDAAVPMLVALHDEQSSDDDEDDGAPDDDDASSPPPGAPSSPRGPSTRQVAITLHGRDLATVELLSQIARDAGWSLTLVGVGNEKIDLDLEAQDAAEALRAVLLKANSLGVLRGDKLAVMAATNGHSPGLLVEQRGGTAREKLDGPNRHGSDLVKVFGDLVVPAGTVVQGDAVAVLGSVEVEPGAVVQGSTAAIGGSVLVRRGAVVLGDSVSLFGENSAEHGAQVLGDHVQVGLGRGFSHAAEHHRSLASRIGPFGLFPSLALFALVYLFGLATLHLWPERVRSVGSVLVAFPLRAFVVGTLCWMLFLPLLILLVVTVVGLLLVPLLPLAVAISVMLGTCGLALRIGEAFPTGEHQKFIAPISLALGLAAVMLATFVPWVGTPLLLVLLVVAPGAAIASRFGRVPASA